MTDPLRKKYNEIEAERLREADRQLKLAEDYAKEYKDVPPEVAAKLEKYSKILDYLPVGVVAFFILLSFAPTELKHFVFGLFGFIILAIVIWRAISFNLRVFDKLDRWADED
jgi:hypothetical protein